MLSACGFGKVSYDTASGLVDGDHDGYGAGVDCDDGSSAIYPGAPERCDGVDNDCDGVVDNDPVDGSDWFMDGDGDGYGDPEQLTRACQQPPGMVADGTDCDDSQADSWPGAAEVCDGRDNDCDGDVDEEAAGLDTWWRDADGDGYGDRSRSTQACEAPSGYVDNPDDCNDSDPDLNPDTPWYGDGDGDGFGDPDNVQRACEIVVGYVANDDDCDDSDVDVSPGADEYCDGVDNDCNGSVDEDDAVDVVPIYNDADGDGWGVGPAVGWGCDAGAGSSLLDADCDDADASIYPWAEEICDDGIDQDCNGRVDNTCPQDWGTGDATWEALGATEWDQLGVAVAVADVDGDSLGDLLVGGPGDDSGASGAGSAWLFYGGISASTDLGAAVLMQATGASDHAGNAVGLPGDVNGDGFPDLAVGAYGDDDGASNAGRGFLMLGPVSGDQDLDDADLVVTDSDAEAAMGRWLVAGGDLSGDSIPDLLLGAAGLSTMPGAAYVFSWTGDAALDAADATAQVAGLTAGDMVGTTGAIGDLDGDGQGDLVLGASGEAALFLGPLSGSVLLSDADASLTGASTGDGFGSAVALGDMDGDGHTDLFVGASQSAIGATDGGAVYMLTGPISGALTAADAALVVYGEQTSGQLGFYEYGLAVGDLDADGRAELVIGWPTDATDASGAGSVSVLYGPLEGSQPISRSDVRIAETTDSARFGQSVALGDVDGDGAQDIVVGSKYGVASAGATHVFTGF